MLPQYCRPAQDDMRSNDTVVTDFHMRANHSIWTNTDIVANGRSVINYRGWMNHLTFPSCTDNIAATCQFAVNISVSFKHPYTTSFFLKGDMQIKRITRQYLALKARVINSRK